MNPWRRSTGIITCSEYSEARFLIGEVFGVIVKRFVVQLNCPKQERIVSIIVCCLLRTCSFARVRVNNFKQFANACAGGSRSVTARQIVDDVVNNAPI